MINKELGIKFFTVATCNNCAVICADEDEQGRLLPKPTFVPASAENITQIAIPGMDGLYIAVRAFGRTEMKMFAACGVNNFSDTIKALAKLGKLLGFGDGLDYVPETAENILKEVV